MVSSHSVSYGILNSRRWFSAAKNFAFSLVKNDETKSNFRSSDNWCLYLTYPDWHILSQCNFHMMDSIHTEFGFFHRRRSSMRLLSRWRSPSTSTWLERKARPLTKSWWSSVLSWKCLAQSRTLRLSLCEDPRTNCPSVSFFVWNEMLKHVALRMKPCLLDVYESKKMWFNEPDISLRTSWTSEIEEEIDVLSFHLQPSPRCMRRPTLWWLMRSSVRPGFTSTSSAKRGKESRTFARELQV